MTYRFKLVIAGAALAAFPSAAHAQASQEIVLNSTVDLSCGIGTPTSTVIDLQDLTGPDGLLDPAKTGSSTIGTTTILDTWCNGPSEMRLVPYPMTLQRSPPYAQPATMTRQLTYNARFIGWGDPVTLRPRNGGDATIKEAEFARAAPATGIQINVSGLQSQKPNGDEQAGLMLEHGDYRGYVEITLTAGN